MRTLRRDPTLAGDPSLRWGDGEGKESKSLGIETKDCRMKLFQLPQGQHWWAVLSRMTGRDGPFLIWHLCWGRDEDEVAANMAEADARLDRTMMEHAIRKGEIDDEAEWEPRSTLIRHQRMIRVETLEEVEACDPGLAEMLREHECFVVEFEADGPGVIGGSFERLSGRD